MDEHLKDAPQDQGELLIDTTIHHQSPSKKEKRQTDSKGVKLQDEEDVQNDDINIIIRNGEGIQHKIRLLDLDPYDTILKLKQLYFKTQLEQGQQVRLITMGRILTDDLLIHSLKWVQQQVILAHISLPIQQEPVPEAVPQSEQQQYQQHMIALDIVPGEPLNEAQMRQEIRNQVLQIILNRQRQQLASQIANLEYQNNRGTFLDLCLGFFVGFIFSLIALFGLCLCNCNIRVKQGIVIGFLLRMIYIQIYFMRTGTTNLTQST